MNRPCGSVPVRYGRHMALFLRIISICATIFFCVALLCGFTLPSSHELRREFQAELKKIREKTPGARARAGWISARDAAQKAVKEAQVNGAPEYAPEEWGEAADLFERARGYARDSSYRKAVYLANKSREIARSASEKASRAREKIEKQLAERLNNFRKELDRIQRVLPGNSEWSVRFADLVIQWSDIKNCVALGLYHEAHNELDTLADKIRKFKQESGVKVNSGTAKWEETI